MNIQTVAEQLADPQPLRRGDWMQTYTGKQFWPLDPRIDEIDIRDIAHALAYTCRYNGHCNTFYSIAEHSVVMSGFASPENRLAALLHDAAEAYICDVPRPLKKHLAGYGLIEATLEGLIAEKFDLPWPWPEEIKILDERILADERDQLMATPPADWALRHPPLNAYLPCWRPAEAETVFLTVFENLTRDNWGRANA
jgi:hypothetical protein